MQLVVVMAVRKAVSAATTTFTLLHVSYSVIRIILGLLGLIQHLSKYWGQSVCHWFPGV